MAGEFVLYRVHPANIATMKSKLGATTTGVAHAVGPDGHGGHFGGWTPDSRKLLNEVRGGRSALANRHELPPHLYVEIPAGALTEAKMKYLHQAPWMADLVRPSDPGFGTANLTADARVAWGLGKKVEALGLQVAHGNVSIEVYYIGSREVKAATLANLNSTIDKFAT